MLPSSGRTSQRLYIKFVGLSLSKTSQKHRENRLKHDFITSTYDQLFGDTGSLGYKSAMGEKKTIILVGLLFRLCFSST